ncbi:sigmaY antisigma factor component [Jeotgalibacillus sp. S-D1]|uniref:sigmaY antisigma factor component n=1 Tax=Jeotgalibacillus sp. S-D1 TaxID=2552189 RepID=UPI001059CBA5|nr:sigmaY antisigma factor component [Jeotgalibacillus sp. S-D1]TDL32072.1 sigmaY antisigma factor component [Jeotgalibacillus sp. S-D1]
MNELESLPLLFYIILVPVLLAQSIYLFIDARKRGHARWFWGIWGMIQTPMPILVYFIWTRKISPFIKKRREDNGRD